MKRGLGKGLDALFTDNAPEDAQGPVTLRLSDIEPNRGQPRKEFDPDALAQLADSIRQHGVLQPLMVRPIPGTGTYQLVAGERRWRAARMAGLSEVPVVIRELDDSEAAEVALIENLQREDLNPIEEAEGYSGLLNTFGLTQDEISRRVGKSRPAVANALRLLNLPSPVLDMVKKGKLSAGHARSLLGVENPERMQRMADEVVRKGLSVRAVEKLIRREERARETPAPARGRSVVVSEVERLLTERLGRKVTVTPGAKKGVVTMEFYGEDDLRQLAGVLCGPDETQKFGTESDG